MLYHSADHTRAPARVKRGQFPKQRQAQDLAFAKAGDEALPLLTQRIARQTEFQSSGSPALNPRDYAPRTTIRLVVSETETTNPTNARVNEGLLYP